jgi:hypothetical protein
MAVMSPFCSLYYLVLWSAYHFGLSINYIVLRLNNGGVFLAIGLLVTALAGYLFTGIPRHRFRLPLAVTSSRQTSLQHTSTRPNIANLILDIKVPQDQDRESSARWYSVSDPKTLQVDHQAAYISTWSPSPRRQGFPPYIPVWTYPPGLASGI